MSDDVDWLEKLVHATGHALEHVREVDDPFSRDLVADLEELHSAMSRRLDEARALEQ